MRFMINQACTELTFCQDIEAQGNTPTATVDEVKRAQSEYKHSGRGGAGNYASTSELAAATIENANVTPALQETKTPEIGYCGRGGAGNYRGEDEEQKREEGRRVSMIQEKAHQQVVRDVEAGLQEPPKAHLGNEKLEYVV